MYISSVIVFMIRAQRVADNKVDDCLLMDVVISNGAVVI
jgi:hypothetical protein